MKFLGSLVEFSKDNQVKNLLLVLHSFFFEGCAEKWHY